MAATTVFDTAELLESILLALPTKDLLLSQRVCKIWKQAITNSKRIRQALFLEPIGLRADGLKLMPGGSNEADGEDSNPSIQECRIFINLLFDDLCGKMIPSKEEMAKGVKTEDLVASKSLFGAIPCKTLNDPDGSVHKMLITPPAIKSLRFHMVATCERFLTGWGSVETVFGDQGITIGHVLEAVQVAREDDDDDVDPYHCKDAHEPGGCKNYQWCKHERCKFVHWWFHFDHPDQKSLELPGKCVLDPLWDNTCLDELRAVLKSGAASSRMI